VIIRERKYYGAGSRTNPGERGAGWVAGSRNVPFGPIINETVGGTAPSVIRHRRRTSRVNSGGETSGVTNAPVTTVKDTFLRIQSLKSDQSGGWEVNDGRANGIYIVLSEARRCSVYVCSFFLDFERKPAKKLDDGTRSRDVRA